MKTQKYIHSILLYILLITIFTCKSPTEPYGGNQGYSINPNLKEIKYSKPKFVRGMYYMSVWRGNTIFAIHELTQFQIDNQLNVLQDTVLDIYLLGRFINWTYIDANQDGSKLLLVESKYGDVSDGALYEYDVPSHQLQLLFDKNHNISSARFDPKNENKIIYYSYGDNEFNGSGYYEFDKIANQKKLLFPFLSSAGPSERLNGFDVHPDGDTLLIPVSQSTFLDSKAPKLGIISLKKQKLDTLNIEFNVNRDRTGLWVRYNKNATRILYSNFPSGAFGSTVSDNSEVGIIDVATGSKKVLDVNTEDETPYHQSVQIAPNWSPDESAIIFGSGEVSLEGALGRRRIWILTKLNQKEK